MDKQLPIGNRNVRLLEDCLNKYVYFEQTLWLNQTRQTFLLWCDNLNNAAWDFLSEMNSCSGDNVDSTGVVGLLWPTQGVKTGTLKPPAPSYQVIWLEGEGGPGIQQLRSFCWTGVHSLQWVVTSLFEWLSWRSWISWRFELLCWRDERIQEKHTNKCWRGGWNPELPPRWVRGSSLLSYVAHNLTILVRSCSEPLQAAACANMTS